MFGNIDWKSFVIFQFSFELSKAVKVYAKYLDCYIYFQFSFELSTRT